MIIKEIKSKRYRIYMAGFAACLLFALAVFLFFTNRQKLKKESTVPNEKNVTITITSNGFNPSNTRIKAGTRVIWVNKSGIKVTVNSDNHPTHKTSPFLNLGLFENDSSVQAVVEKSGTYTYHNHFDPSQKGKITVE